MKRVKIWFTSFSGNELDLSECTHLEITGTETKITDGFYWILTEPNKSIGINMNLISKIENIEDLDDDDIPF